MRKKVIEYDFAMNNGVLTIETNASLIQYVLDVYNINIYTKNAVPEGQQLEINNRQELKPYLPY